MSQSETDKLTESVKEVARRHGAVLVGVAPVARFDPLPPLHDAVPEGHHPTDFLPEAQSVISVAMPILDPVMDAPAVLAERELQMIPPHVRYPYFEQLYNRVGHVVHDCMLEFIGQMVGQHLLGEGYRAMIFPTTGLHPGLEGMTDEDVWEGRSGQTSAPPSPFRYTFGPFSHRHAATRAGLGEFGYNNLVLTKQFGPRQRFNSIITDAELAPDPLVTEPICLRDRCRLCLEACIMDCIYLRDDPSAIDYRSVEQVDRGKIFIDTPAKTDPTLCRRRREGKPESPIRGDCARICPVPAPPKHLTERLKRLVDRCGWPAEDAAR